jgi:small subunit ribosomal protein S9
VAERKTGYFEGVGRRKCSTARVRIYKGKGVTTVNERPIEEYFLVDKMLANAQKSLKVAGLDSDYYFTVKTNGGGIAGQSDAVSLGLARAIIKMDPDKKPVLKKEDLVSRDARIIQRKKAGFRKARKKPQFSKR